ncbi:MAG: orotate phosphoribosyltransferase [Candidatus Hadarchaeales archaeon]
MDKRALAQALMDCGCIKVGHYKLTSGSFSPYYIDLRMVPSFPQLFREVVRAYLILLREERVEFERVLGVPTAGIPLGVLVAHELGKPFLYLRMESKTHGTERLLEGELREGERVLLVDDVATTGGSLKRAAQVVRGEGGRVEAAAVLVDREQGAKELLKREGVKLLSVMTAREIFQELYTCKKITEKEYGEIMRYMEGRKNV